MIKTSVLIMMIAATLFAQQKVSLAIPASESKSAVGSVRQFAIGGIGVAGTMSDGERQLRMVLQEPNASQQLQTALEHATLASQLYILVGLRRCDSAAYQKIFPTLPRSKEEVEVIRGCIISREPFEKLLSEINDGHFDLYLSQPAR